MPEDKIPTVSRFLGRAFFADPLAAYMFQNPEVRKVLLPLHFETLLRYGYLAEKAWTTQDLAGVIVCQPPGRTTMDLEAMKSSGMLDEADRVGKDEFGRFTAVTRYMEPLRARDAGPKHWYVMALGVDPEKQGLGAGRALLAHVARLADSARVPCYLETAEPRNVDFYQKNGYGIAAEGIEPKSGMRFWTFRRRPTPG